MMRDCVSQILDRGFDQPRGKGFSRDIHLVVGSLYVFVQFCSMGDSLDGKIVVQSDFILD